MLLPEALNETQLITLRDVLRTAGLKERQIEDIQLLLRFKPHRVQLAFYYTTIGLSQRETSAILGCAQSTVWHSVNVGCCDIRNYLAIDKCR